MNKNIVLLFFIFLASPFIVYSITSLTFQETDKIVLVPDAIDPDNDKLSVAYAPPLNENGEWQTTYGDAGEYKSAIIVSDGEDSDTRELLIIVERKEEPPVTDDYSPREASVFVKEGLSLKFALSATDLNKDVLFYWWALDGIRVQDGSEFTYDIGYGQQGTHTATAFVSDGMFNITKEWIIEVENVDVDALFDEIQDIVVNENEIARLNLPDFSKYRLEYSVSDPIGNDNEWHTTYDDAGSYSIRVHAEGKEFSGDTVVDVIVNDVDRPVAFEGLENIVVDENQKAVITLKATDPDDDRVTYTLEKAPYGATLDDNVFEWTPDFDAVKREGFIDGALERFGTLTDSYNVQFSASSKDKKAVGNIIVTVRDVNRPPVIDDIAPIAVNEGETITIVPKAYDPDGDKVKLSYSGFLNTDTYAANFDDAGDYTVRVIASDGKLEAFKDVKIAVKPTNRVPVFSEISSAKAKEGDAVEIMLDAYDPDGDKIEYMIENPPEGASVKGNLFSWVPGFNVASKDQVKRFSLLFIASDGNLWARQTVVLDIADANRLPRIVNITKSIDAVVNHPVLMVARAVDDDGDPLEYTWDFGLLDTYKATANHYRTFTSTGNKIVKVTVSDGMDSIEQMINVYVHDDPDAVAEPKLSVGYRVTYVNITYNEEKSSYKQNSVSSSQARSGGDSNSAPRIIDYSRGLTARVGQPVLMSVKAVDDDGDRLSYTWDFGLFDTHKGTANHQRTFSSTGNKDVKVTVSDGRNSVTQNINVNVV